MNDQNLLKMILYNKPLSFANADSDDSESMGAMDKDYLKLEKELKDY